LSDVSRLQVQSGDLDFKIQEVEAAFKRQVETQLQQARDRLNELEVMLPAAIKIRDVKLQYAGGAAQGGKHLVSITRTRNGHTVVLDGNETMSVEPGDVIDIKNEMPRVMPHDEAAAGQLTSRSYKTEETRAGETIGAISR
jgi:polysaccharide export outer membrane protein